MSPLESRGAWFREARRGGLGSDGFPEARIGRGGLGTDRKGGLSTAKEGKKLACWPARPLASG